MLFVCFFDWGWGFGKVSVHFELEKNWSVELCQEHWWRGSACERPVMWAKRVGGSLSFTDKHGVRGRGVC